MANLVSFSSLALLLFIAVNDSVAFVSPSSIARHRLLPSKKFGLRDELRRFDTSLPMGIRSFVKNQIINRIGGNDESHSNSTKKFTADSRPEHLAEETEEVVPPGVSGKDDNQDDRPAYKTRPETPQERIQRVKSGRMTDDEKQAFVDVALAAGDATHRKPLRQHPLASDLDEYNKGRRRSSPMRDVIFGRGKDNDPVAQSVASKVKMDSNKKKRDYFEMVTNPNRFNAYKSAPHVEKDPSMLPLDPDPIPESVEVEADDISIETPMAAPIIWELPVLEVAEEFNAPTELLCEDINTPTDLGRRLQAAALADEERRKAMREQVTQQRIEEDRRLNELIRQREEEQFLRETELLARQKEKAAAAALAAEEVRLAEEARQRELIAAQDEYWKKTLRKSSPTTSVAQQETPNPDFSSDDEIADASDLGEQYPDPVVDTVLAGLQSLNDVKRVKNPIDGLKGESGKFNYILEQTRKKAEIDKAKNEQLAKLRALNSPLPSGLQSGITPSIAPVRNDPRQPVATKKPDVGPLVQRQTLNKNLVTPPLPPLTAKPAERSMTMKDIMRQRAIEVAAKGGTSSSPATPPVSSSVPPPNSSTALPQVQSTDVIENGGGRRALGRLLGGTVPPKESEKRIVRQQIPVESDDDDDFDAFSRNGSKNNLSIADAQKLNSNNQADIDEQSNRSKQWGIDMSKYSQD